MMMSEMVIAGVKIGYSTLFLIFAIGLVFANIPVISSVSTPDLILGLAIINVLKDIAGEAIPF